jgi:CRP-like cAMP-binding protein
VALSRIIHIGDRIRFGDLEGEVMDINWSRTVLRTWEGRNLFIPNSELQKGTFTNFNYPDRNQRCRLDVGVSYDVPPQKIKKALLRCVQNVDGISQNPAPEVLLVSYGDSAVNYALTFWIKEYSKHREITSEVSTRVWYAFKRESIEIPYPIRTVRLARKSDAPASVDPESVLSGIDLFKGLPSEEQDLLQERFKRQSYINGEIIVRQGDLGSSFYVVVKGRVEVLRHTKEGKNVLVGELKPGQFFGELSLLTGEPRSATVRAAADSDLLRLEKSDFQDILSRHPALAENMAEVVALRQSALAGIQDASADSQLPEKKSALSSRIRKFFNLKSEHAFFALIGAAGWAAVFGRICA